MPKNEPKTWGQLPRLGSAARAGLLIVCRCALCKRQRVYLAGDLADIFGAQTIIGEIWGRCPRCRKSDYWSEGERYPNRDDIGHLVVRRPAGVRKTQLWRDEYYGPSDPAAPQATSE